VNSVTHGNYDRPQRIAGFLNELLVGASSFCPLAISQIDNFVNNQKCDNLSHDKSFFPINLELK
jgi:hypothetical protein